MGQLRGGSLGKTGLLESSRGGTVYLPPESWLIPPIQVKLLRLLQEGMIVPVGGVNPYEIDVRIIFGLHQDPDSEIAAGRLRRDLADLLGSHTLFVPPLRERPEDLPLLMEMYIKKHQGEDVSFVKVPPKTLALLTRYHWPGNANELEEEVRSMLALSAQGSLDPEDVSPRIRQAAGLGPQALTKALEGTTNLKEAISILERELSHEGLIRTRWNKSALARQLGVSRANLLAKVKKYKLDRPRSKTRKK